MLGIGHSSKNGKAYSVPANDGARHRYIGMPAAVEIPSPGDRTEPRYKVEWLDAVAAHDEVRHELAVDLIQLHVIYPVIACYMVTGAGDP